MTKVLLDTNVLVYAVNPDSEFHQQVKDFILGLVEKEIKTYIPDKSLYEFYRVLSSQVLKKYFTQEEAKKTWKTFAFSEFFEIAYSDEAILRTTDKLLDKFPNYHVFDMQIMACGLVNRVNTIFTKNLKDFPRVNEVTIVDPTIG
ncbi:MAG: type II toxin-antitoxin system VapC family toxin [Patescibacteria group bacterium]